MCSLLFNFPSEHEKKNPLFKSYMIKNKLLSVKAFKKSYRRCFPLILLCQKYSDFLFSQSKVENVTQRPKNFLVGQYPRETQREDGEHTKATALYEDMALEEENYRCKIMPETFFTQYLDKISDFLSLPKK